LIALPNQAELLLAPLFELKQLRLKVCSTVDEAAQLMRNRSPKIVIADYERFGAAGVDGLADLMARCDAPVILLAREVGQCERQQFVDLGVQRVFVPPFGMSELVTEVDRALKHGRIGSSDRLPAVV
jgi:DNA-binding response OmpR family regulator